jgi:hypothetical protein
MNETPSKAQHLLTITLPKDYDTKAMGRIDGATIINQIE